MQIEKVCKLLMISRLTRISANDRHEMRLFQRCLCDAPIGCA